MNVIYLIPGPDYTYSAVVAPRRPTPNAVLLAKEKPYPCSVVFERRDHPLHPQLRCIPIYDRNQLLDVLNYLGVCRFKIEELWDYNTDYYISQSLDQLFSDCQKRAEEIFYEAYDEYDEYDYYGDYDDFDEFDDSEEYEEDGAWFDFPDEELPMIGYASDPSVHLQQSCLDEIRNTLFACKACGSWFERASIPEEMTSCPCCGTPWDNHPQAK